MSNRNGLFNECNDYLLVATYQHFITSIIVKINLMISSRMIFEKLVKVIFEQVKSQIHSIIIDFVLIHDILSFFDCS